MFFIYANAKSEIQICSNIKHEIGLALLVQYFHNNLDFRPPLVIFCHRTAQFMSDLVINPEDRNSHDEAHMFSDCTYDMKTYKHGVVFTAADGCNLCTCNNGTAFCANSTACDQGRFNQRYQMTVMRTTRAERRLIGFRCQKASMKSKLIISCKMMHNQKSDYELFHWLTKGDEQMDDRTHTTLCAQLRFVTVQYCLNF